jgi:hypothetical protein
MLERALNSGKLTVLVEEGEGLLELGHCIAEASSSLERT